MKKNLQIDALKKVFADNGDLDLFYEKVLFIKSNSDCVMDNLLEVADANKIPESITEVPVYVKLHSAVRYCKKFENSCNWEIQESVNLRKDQILNELEPAFRFYIKKKLKDEIKDRFGKRVSYKVKLDYVDRVAKKDWQWILSLYPQILTTERQVYVMSMDKFLLRNDPILEGTYFIYKRLCDRSIIFIDEFDATKETVLKRLVENAIKNKIDYISAFSRIRDKLIEGNFPEEMTIPSKRQMNSINGIERLKKVIPGWNERVLQINNRFSMQYVFKNTQSVSENDTFLFQDVHSLLVSKKSDKKRIAYKTNGKKSQNDIFLSSDVLEDEKSFTYMVKDVRGFLRFFCGGVWILGNRQTNPIIQ